MNYSVVSLAVTSEVATDVVKENAEESKRLLVTAYFAN